ncbi:hypothetical protein [Enterococcus asini]|uniref:hypothetical protein n=1 Tax=Enterococcus asini TaxID=57732 RepID=UPI0022E78D7B|nr:hypothetical protein [Enterococcus asini]
MRKSKERLEQISFSILRTVKANANIEILINDEFSYFDLMEALEDLKRNQLLRDYLGKLELTKYGMEELNGLEATMKIGNVGNLIIPDFRYFIDKIDINDVYLP